MGHKPLILTLFCLIYLILLSPASASKSDISISLQVIQTPEIRRLLDHFKNTLQLRITLMNNSNHIVHFFEDQNAIDAGRFGERNYYIDIQDSLHRSIGFQGGKTPYTNKVMMYPDIYRRISLKPKEAITEIALANSLYDLSNPGTYFIHVERKMPPELGGGFVSSNVVRVVLTD